LQNRADEIRKQYHIPESAIVFGFVGRVVKDKGIIELIMAFKIIIEIRKDMYLLLVGPLEQELDPLPAEVLHFIQHDEHVVLAGYQNDVRPWMVASDVFVFPSYREGFPNVVMQAACLELPCIVSDINGCNEIIEDKVSGLIVRPKDAKALYEAMQEMILDTEQRKLFAKKSRAFVSTHFDQLYVWRELLGEYLKQLRNENLEVRSKK
jgi:glycosyltransferase involved in cell wall biosynthesis